MAIPNPTSPPDLLAPLNPAQKKAVLAVDGPVMVLAGPGSGKTRVLIHRVGYLIQDLGIAPWRILAVTFTNKAAKEMKERLLNQRILTENSLHSLTVGTFHAICARMLRRDIEKLGHVDNNFVIFDSDDQQKIVKRILKELNLDSKRFTPRSIHSAISKAKNDLKSASDYIGGDYWQEIVSRVYLLYEETLLTNNALDFDDLIFKTHQLLSQEPEVLAYYQERYQHVMVDEFQDTNMAQYELVQLLAGGHRNLFAVGDEDQSIYSWRGADYRNVMRFQQDYPDAQTILLEQNYRSTETILQAASQIIAQNAHRHPKNLFTERGSGEQVVVVESFNGSGEAQFIVDEISRLNYEKGIALSDVAVMYRTNAQSRQIEEAFIRANMPYRLVRGFRFYERKEVKDALAYLRLIHNPNDSVSLERVINEPSRGIGRKTLSQLFEWAAQLGYSPWQSLVHLHNILVDEVQPQAEMPFGTRARRSLNKFTKIMLFLIAGKEKIPLTELIDLVLARTGYRDFLRDGSEEGEDRWENLQELKTVAKGYEELSPPEALAQFLEEVALVSDSDALNNEEAGPALLTLHTAKGLEFPVVFMAGMEDGLFPHSRSRDDPEQMEEERRLAYVGMTRAKNKLYLTRAFRRAIYGYDETVSAPSPFLSDLPENLIDIRHAHNHTSDSFGRGRRNQSRYRQQTQWSSPAPQKPKPKPASLQSRYSRSRTQETPAASSTGPSFETGEQVQHSKFGKGTVISVDTKADTPEVTVAFPGKGIKKLLGDYLSKA